MPKKSNAPLVEKKQATSLSEEHLDAIARTESVGTAMMQSAQQVVLAIETILMRNHEMNEEQIRKMEEELRHMLVTLDQLEDRGLFVLSYDDMKHVADIAERRANREYLGKKDIILPTSTETKKLTGKN